MTANTKLEHNEVPAGITRRRISVAAFLFTLVCGVLVSKLAYVQVFQGDKLTELAQNQQLKKWEIPAKRGKIYIRDGQGDYPVALNETVQLFYVDPAMIEDKQAFASAVAPILQIKRDKILKKINTKSRYVIIDKELSRDKAKKISALDMEGLVLVDNFKRVYPENSYLSHILGYVDSDGSGAYGIEGYLNNELSGVNGTYRASTDKNGVEILSASNAARAPVAGSSAYLTIDRDIQASVEQTLKKAINDFEAEGGSVVVLNPKNGDVMALANYPDFDPNQYFKVKKYQRFENFAFSRVYEPGSVFKIFTMAAGLNENAIEPSTTFVDPGKIRVNDHTIRNSDLKRHGRQTMTEVLEKSLNTGTTWILKKLGGGKINNKGVRKFYSYLEKFGFGDKTGIETDLEAEGFVSKPLTVSNHTYATMTFGQSIAVSPIQLASAVGAIANDGVLMQPHLIDRVETSNGKVKETSPTKVREVITKEAAARLKAMMVSVVVRGHGKQAGVKGYRVAGKTGTAQIPKPGGGYFQHANTGSFIGFAPAENPQFVIVVKIDKPKIAWAESSAAPVFGEIASFLVRYLEIPPSTRR